MSVPAGVDAKNVSEKAAYKIPPINVRWDNGIRFK
jgi:hypothetical protein